VEIGDRCSRCQQRGAGRGATRGERYPGIKIEGTRQEGLKEKEMTR
jgi:hypothetical protein